MASAGDVFGLQHLAVCTLPEKDGQAYDNN